MPAPEGDETGNARFRKTWLGKLVLQVECSGERDDALGGPVVYWRDAEERDLHRVRKMRSRHGLDPLI